MVEARPGLPAGSRYRYSTPTMTSSTMTAITRAMTAMVRVFMARP
jgi:hypothetical protein